jgi:glycosyltransferase involved in cell wall biosynthesis
VNFLTGDFIERHARAASLFFPVRALFVVKDNDLPFGQVVLEHCEHNEHYETFVYYYSSRLPVAPAEKLASVWMQARCLYKGFRAIVAAHGLPALVHAHVLIRHAWFALKQSERYNLPLLASEQWTGYLPQAAHEFEKLGGFQKRQLKKIFNAAVHVTTVSEYLSAQIRKRFPHQSHSVIPNLVDMSVFVPREYHETIATFIHVSTLSSQKNFDEIIQACTILKSGGNRFQLVVVAPVNDFYRGRVQALGLENEIIFEHEVPQDALSGLIAVADALILYSNYETFGCVIVEANACGVPVIVSDFPVFNENVQEGVTGFKVPLHNPAALAGRMLKIINRDHSFDKAAIVRITRDKYAFEVVGKQFASLYERYAKP